MSLTGCTIAPRDSADVPDKSHFEMATTFDEFDAEFHDGGGLTGVTNDSEGTSESGLLAWGESYVMRAYLLMYLAHDDESYLDAFIEHADAVLQNRDSERGVTDYRGKSLPVWRADSPYTIGRVRLPDEAGQPSLEVRTAAAYGDRSTATVSTASGSDGFDLVVRNSALGRTTSYEGLTMDPDDVNYAVTRINHEGFPEETPDSCLVTVRDIQSTADDVGTPVAGEYGLDSPHYIFAVHTGLITLPLATFARLVAETSELRERPRYEERASQYRRAAERAVRVHDPQWRLKDEREGYYVFTPGSPTPNESVELPHNQSLALGLSLSTLAAVTGDSSYAKRAQRLARTFRNDLRVDESGAYVWSYYWSKGQFADGWSTADPASEYRPWAPGLDDAVEDRPEDINHGHIDIEFATSLYNRTEAGERGSPFTAEDMIRLARTYTRNVAVTEDGSQAANYHVNGTGATDGDHETKTAIWAGLSPWNEEVFSHSASLFEQNRDRFDPGPDTLLAIAKLNYWSAIRS
ncbi:hypothetical protein [Halostella salina]|uniref:hypothetical protein n=1 Tax=Halostella salina TaxID=1547897 RepID=UPI000EF78E3F|nr:hypothetical protein [Halostella salina]